MKDLFNFLRSRVFWINLIVYAILVGGGFFALLTYLRDFTLLNQTIQVEDFKGYHKSELENIFEASPFRYEIVDSLYDPKQDGGVVLSQIPEAGREVKENRKIYLTINASSPPKVKVPDLRDRSKRQAIAVLETYGLELNEFRYVPSICVDCVIDLEIDSLALEPGSMIDKGSKVNLVLGGGESTEFIPVPLLIDLNFEDASRTLKMNGLNPVIVHEDYESEEDSLNARIWHQIPPYDSLGLVRLGSEVKIFFTADYNKIPQMDVDTVSANTTAP